MTSYDGGNIILGGDGSDTLEGRGGDDILDGDKWLDVQLSVRTNPADPARRSAPPTAWSELQAGRVRRRHRPGQHRDRPGDPDGNGVGHRPGDVLRHPGRLPVHRPLRGDSAAAGAVPADLGRRTAPGEPHRRRRVPGVRHDGTDIVENVETLVFSDSAPPEAPTGVTAVPGNGSAQVNSLPPASVVTSYEVAGPRREPTSRSVPCATDRSTRTIASLLVDGLTNGADLHGSGSGASTTSGRVSGRALQRGDPAGRAAGRAAGLPTRARPATGRSRSAGPHPTTVARRSRATTCGSPTSTGTEVG